MKAVVDGPHKGRFVDTEAAGRVALGVHVNEEDAAPEGGEAGTEVDRGGGLADSAFLVNDCYYAAQLAPTRCGDGQ
jgi:hypothetical protein